MEARLTSDATHWVAGGMIGWLELLRLSSCTTAHASTREGPFLSQNILSSQGQLSLAAVPS